MYIIEDIDYQMTKFLPALRSLHFASEETFVLTTAGKSFLAKYNTWTMDRGRFAANCNLNDIVFVSSPKFSRFIFRRFIAEDCRLFAGCDAPI